MSRLTAVSIAAAMIVAGCMANLPTDIPSVTPALSSGAGTPAPTVPLLPVSPGTSATSAPMATDVVEDFGAETQLFSDGFDNVPSGWGTGTTPGGNIAYVDGALQFDTNTAGNWIWSRRTLPGTHNVVRTEGTFTPSNGGYQGLLCASSDDLLFGAVANATGRWAFIQLTGDGAEILNTGEGADWRIGPGVSTRMALDCAGTASGSFRVQLSLPDVGLGTIFEWGTLGAASFDRIGLYAEASTDPYSLRVDDFAAFGDGLGALDSRGLVLYSRPAVERPNHRARAACRYGVGVV